MSATVSTSKQLQPLRALHDVGKVADGLGIADVAAERHLAHAQMLLDQPGGGFHLGWRQAQARPQASGDAGADDGVILVAPLGDVVQERRNVERAAVLDGVDDAGGQGMGIGSLTALDVGQHADGADQMLVDREAMVHVELHHRHDAAEVGNETAEHAGLVHAPQRRLRVLGGGEHLQEDAIGLLVVAQLVVDEPQRAAQQPHGVRVEECVRLLGPGKEADEVDGIALEDVGVGDVEAAVVDAEIGGGADVPARAPAERIEQARRALASP